MPKDDFEDGPSALEHEAMIKQLVADAIEESNSAQDVGHFLEKVSGAHLVLAFSLEQLKALRESMQSLLIRNMISAKFPALVMVDRALRHFGLRFEFGFYVPDGHYLDLLHSRIVEDGKYIHPFTKVVVDIPEGSTYDRKKGQLVAG